MNITELWSRLTPESLTAAAFSGDGVVLGDAGGLLLRYGGNGAVISETPFPPPIRDVCSSRDGRVVGVLCGDGELVCLAEGEIRFRMPLAPDTSMLRCGNEGDYLLALAPSGRGVFVNRYGRVMAEVDLPYGADSVALVPKNGRLLAATRDGVIQCFTSWGKPLWKTELNLATNRICASDSGDLILIPTMAFGVEAMTVQEDSIGAYEVGDPIRHAGCSADGELLLFATMRDRLILLDREATVRSSSSFSSQVASLEVSADGERVLLTTECGYAHVLALTEFDGAPLLEVDESSPGCSNPRPLYSRRVFSPYSMLMQARASFAPGSDSLVIAGDRQRVQVLDMNGEEVARRRFAGSLLDLEILSEGTVRVFSSRSVFTFTPRGHGTRTVWGETSEIAKICRVGGDRALALTEDSEIVHFPSAGQPADRLFHIDSPEVTDFIATDDGVAVVIRGREIVVHDFAGEILGYSGPWPVRPRFLAAGASGYLVGVEKLILLLGPDGAELWRTHLSAPARTGHALPGTFLVRDHAGTVHAITSGGQVHRAFKAGNARVAPFPDGGDGPGFVLIEGCMLTAVHPNGQTRWRYRAKDDVTCTAASPDGRWLAVMAGIDLFVLPLIRPTSVPAEHVERTTYLEFADG